MSARGILRRLIVSAVMLFALSTSVFAGSVQLQYNTVQGSHGSAGLYKFKVLSTDPAFPYAVNTYVNTFCISPTIGLEGTDTYTLRDDIENMPTNIPAIAAMGSQKATKVAILINEVFGSGSKNSFNNSSNSGAGWAAVQYSIWEIITNTPQGPSTGGLSTAVDNLLGHVNTLYTSLAGADALRLYNYFNNIGNTNPNNKYIHGLDAAGNGQDHIYWTSTPNYVIQVPVPAGVIMAGIGMVCLGGFTYLRRRNLVAAV
jgi:hypothetical protein